MGARRSVFLWLRNKERTLALAPPQPLADENPVCGGSQKHHQRVAGLQQIGGAI